MKTRTPWIRADEWLLQHHLAETRTQAQAMIFARSVRLSAHGGVDKPSRKIPANALLQLDKKIYQLNQTTPTDKL
ncbi:MAG: hypothetical protein LBG09_03130 [Puniceicoccales bacterium]|nr:hypothetical protein [Puniceicoccales bacterium]